jgi:hypothetical protein
MAATMIQRRALGEPVGLAMRVPHLAISSRTLAAVASVAFVLVLLIGMISRVAGVPVRSEAPRGLAAPASVTMAGVSVVAPLPAPLPGTHP